QMQFDFLAQPPLKADAIAVAHDQHPDHKLWINRRPADLAVERCQLLTKSSQQPCHHRIDPAQQMTSRNALFKVEQVEQMALIARLPTHHGKPPPLIASSRRNHCSLMSASPFSTLSVISRPTLTGSLCPLLPCKRTSNTSVGRSDSCHKRSLASVYSITSSARASKDGGTLRSRD